MNSTITSTALIPYQKPQSPKEFLESELKKKINEIFKKSFKTAKFELFYLDPYVISEIDTSRLLSLGTSYFPDKSFVKFIEREVKRKLSLTKDIFVKDITSGSSECPVFLMSDGTNNYAVKFFGINKDFQEEIYYSNIASQKDFGAKLYYSTPSLLIMEFGSYPSHFDADTDQFYIDLGVLLRKIHQMKPLSNSKLDLLSDTKELINECISTFKNFSPLMKKIIKLEQIFDIIYPILLPHLTYTLCHNDLISINILSFKEKPKAIDYGRAALNDPYYDLAAICQLTFHANPENEQIITQIYFKKNPSKEQKAKLYLMKQIFLLRQIFIILYRISSKYSLDFFSEYESIPDTTRLQLLEERKNLDFSLRKNFLLKCLKFNINLVFKSFDSDELKDAIKTLKTASKIL